MNAKTLIRYLETMLDNYQKKKDMTRGSTFWLIFESWIDTDLAVQICIPTINYFLIMIRITRGADNRNVEDQDIVFKDSFILDRSEHRKVMNYIQKRTGTDYTKKD